MNGDSCVNMLTNLFKSSKMSGSKKLRSDQSSARLFCNGVPVSKSRFAVLYVFNSLEEKYLQSRRENREKWKRRQDRWERKERERNTERASYKE